MWTTQRDEYKIKLLVLAQRNETECIDTTKSPADTHHFKILPILSDILCQTKISCKDIAHELLRDMDHIAIDIGPTIAKAIAMVQK